jgi:hypothetical protein
MPCVCAKCLRHCRTLALKPGPDTKAVVHKAYRKAAKTWHPDRFNREPGKSKEAEELFRQIHVAYEELIEHLKCPVELPSAKDPFAVRTDSRSEPAISFGGAPGCYASPNFPMRALEIILELGQDADQAIAVVDLTASASGKLAQFLLLTVHGIFVRDRQNRVSLLWYHDMGEVKLVDSFRDRSSAIWRKLSSTIVGQRPRLRLEVHRRDGGRLFAVASEANDNVKKVLYRFLQQKKTQAQP